jgi:uncharacterized SAM-binding protein YcdF (DUF218 family)
VRGRMRNPVVHSRRSSATDRLTGQRGGIFATLLVLLLVFALLAGLYLFRRPILRGMGGLWVVDEPPQPADAILLLGDDNYFAERAARAAELYRAGWAPRIVASGRWLRPYISIADLMERDLAECGIPTAAIVRHPNRAANTFEEAHALLELTRAQRWRRLLVVTSNSHTRRARYIFRNVFGTEAEIRVVAAPDSAYDPRVWWQTRAGVKTFFYETVGMIVALWEVNRHAPASAPP